LEEELNGQTAIIGIKRMGELDEKPFYNACKRKYGKDDLKLSWSQVGRRN